MSDAFGVRSVAVRYEGVSLEVHAPALTRVSDKRSGTYGFGRCPRNAICIGLLSVKPKRDRNIYRFKLIQVYFHRAVTDLGDVRLYSRIERMESTAAEKELATFERYRPRLFGLAYRMMATPDEAEEIVQDAYIRWHTADIDAVENPEAWLVSTTTRLSIDRLRKASRQRESYIGPWLPEPLMISPNPSPQEDAELAESLSTAFLLMLERLSPAERAVFLLHDVFDSSYADIAKIMDREEPAVRQMLHRARQRVRTDKPRFEIDKAEQRSLVERFARAAYVADEGALLELFSRDIAVISDGGGKVTAARKIVQGVRKVLRIFTIAIPPAKDKLTFNLADINGEPGVVEYYDEEPFAANTFQIENGKIAAVYRIMNPDKLKLLKNLKG